MTPKQTESRRRRKGNTMKKFTVDGREFTEAREVAQYIIDNADLTEIYNDMLDECYGMVNVCGYEYYPSVALERLDPIAYRCGYSDFADSLYDDLIHPLENIDGGDFAEFYGITVEVEESEAA